MRSLQPGCQWGGLSHQSMSLDDHEMTCRNITAQVPSWISRWPAGLPQSSRTALSPSHMSQGSTCFCSDVLRSLPTSCHSNDLSFSGCSAFIKWIQNHVIWSFGSGSRKSHLPLLLCSPGGELCFPWAFFLQGFVQLPPDTVLSVASCTDGAASQ